MTFGGCSTVLASIRRMCLWATPTEGSWCACSRSSTQQRQRGWSSSTRWAAMDADGSSPSGPSRRRPRFAVSWRPVALLPALSVSVSVTGSGQTAHRRWAASTSPPERRSPAGSERLVTRRWPSSRPDGRTASRARRRDSAAPCNGCGTRCRTSSPGYPKTACTSSRLTAITSALVTQRPADRRHPRGPGGRRHCPRPHASSAVPASVQQLRRSLPRRGETDASRGPGVAQRCDEGGVPRCRVDGRGAANEALLLVAGRLVS